MSNFVLGPNQTKWLEALESGKYPQGMTYLNKNNRFCCLGVACEIFEIQKVEIHQDGVVTYGEGDEACMLMPQEGIEKLALFSDNGGIPSLETCLATMNDDDHKTFKEIAQFIRANPEKVFRESK